MKLCITCKHRVRHDDDYRHWSKLGLSECEKTRMLYDSEEWTQGEDVDGEMVRRIKPAYANNKAFVQDASDYSAYLLVKDDFGCVMHEEKTL